MDGTSATMRNGAHPTAAEVNTMKRLMYISTTTRKLSDAEVDEIAAKSVVNNSRDRVTGVLLSAHEFFFQILEGESEDVDRVLTRIRNDVRHRDILILKAEPDVKERIFSEWSMNTVRLEGTGDLLLEAIRIMLENITESHRIIERYTQPAVLAFMTEGINPLTVPVKKTQSVILFADIVAFSYFSSLYPVEEVSELVNLFLDVSSKIIVNHGGQVTKYVGDCVVAYFPEDGVDNALRASIEILESVRNLRNSAGKCRLQSFLYCGIGLSKGSVIEGNIGSSTKLDYTVLGDIVNLAARLEALTRSVGKALALSDEVRTAAKENWTFVNVGEFQLKGQADAQSIHSIAHDAVDDFPSYKAIIESASGHCEIKPESELPIAPPTANKGGPAAPGNT
jgi:class 3 adenylate cyclase